MGTIEHIRRHCQTLAGLRRRKLSAERGMRTSESQAPVSPEGPASFQETSDEATRVNDEEEREEEVEEESDLLLALSESSPSAAGSVASEDDLSDLKEAESEREEDVTVIPSKAVSEKDDEGTSSDESRASVIQLQEQMSSDETEDEEVSQRELEDVMFAQDYLHRVCEAVKECSGLSEQLLQMLEDFSAAGPSGASGTPEVLYRRLSSVLQPWPQLLKDFAAFLNRRQARGCGLLLEQRLFERSRRFLRRLGRNLGENSLLYQEVVSVLQGSSAPSSEDIDKVSSLLKQHPDLQEEVQEFFQQLHTRSSPEATGSENTNVDSTSQNPRDENRGSLPAHTGSDNEDEQHAVCAKNITVTSNGKKVVVWTREADRIILTACQQRGATRKTFRQVSSQLGNKTVQQVRFRFQDLMKLFHSAPQKSTYCSSKGPPTSRRSAAPD
ncbi:GON-4-like protein [Austrofundulus limnaeus]|uniref:GON-4-like protein n=1 Tax=Austrofundulus limnaeus TaxID=52670 RepID=A0A2I4CD32_AUSLI|nr:PREDICTED: GON-4-like protein [Austrofundulus limnaeus]